MSVGSNVGRARRAVDELRTAGQNSVTAWDESKNIQGDKPQGPSDDIVATIDSIFGSSSDEAFTSQSVTYI